MTGHGFLHPVRTASGALLATLRCTRDESTARLEWLDAAGALVLTADVNRPEATRILDGAGRDIPWADLPAAQPTEPAIRVIGSTAVMRSWEVAGHPAWVVDDYGSASRHFIFGCAPDLFLHVHLDAQGTVTVTEKTRQHATLRCVRRDATGALLADEALVQPGEDLADIARRCGVATDALRAANATLAGGPPPVGMVVRLA